MSPSRQSPQAPPGAGTAGAAEAAGRTGCCDGTGAGLAGARGIAADCCAPEGAADLEGEGPPPPQETKVAASSSAPRNRVQQHRFVIGNIPAPRMDPLLYRYIYGDAFPGPGVHLSRT